MLIVQAFDVKDTTIKDQLYAALQKEMSEAEVETLSPIIEQAFVTGSEVWESQHLPDILGKEVAKQFIGMTRKTRIGGQ